LFLSVTRNSVSPSRTPVTVKKLPSLLIVITAVYILRVVGKILFQTIPNKKFYELHDASWDERFAIAGLIFCVAGLGICPLFFENMIIDAVHPIFEHIIEYVPQLGNL